MSKREKQRIEELRKKARNKTKKCYNPDCSEDAIRSHVLQVEGGIREISSVNSKVVQLDSCSPFENSIAKFKEVGIRDRKGDVLNFWGFCNRCDTRIFSSIEQKDVDYRIYENQLLCSYRGLVSELYQQEYNLKHYELIFKDRQISKSTKDKWFIKYKKYEALVNDSRFYKELLEKEIFFKKTLIDYFFKRKEVKNFIFSCHELDRIEVGSSACYGYGEIKKLSVDEIKAISNFKYYEPINSIIFFNLIPQMTKTVLIIGTNKIKPNYASLDIIEYLDKSNKKEKLKFISDVLIKHVSTWFISTRFYSELKKTKKDKKIIKNINKYFHYSMKTKDIEFNIFE